MKVKDLYEMSAQDLRDAEYVIEYLFRDLKLDVVWSTHFTERILGRESNITKQQLIAAFQKLKTKYGAQLVAARDKHVEFIGILKDVAEELNIPFVINFSKINSSGNKYILRGITIMQKDTTKFVSNLSGGSDLPV